MMALCLHEGSVGFRRNDKLRVKTVDRWTYELAVLQGQRGIALLLSRAACQSGLCSHFFIIFCTSTKQRENGTEETKRRGTER